MLGLPRRVFFSAAAAFFGGMLKTEDEEKGENDGDRDGRNSGYRWQNSTLENRFAIES